jgi:hypothetical protein
LKYTIISVYCLWEMRISSSPILQYQPNSSKRLELISFWILIAYARAKDTKSEIFNVFWVLRDPPFLVLLINIKYHT